MPKSIMDRMYGYRLVERHSLEVAMAETEEAMEQIERATTLAQSQELAKAWLLVWRDRRPESL